MSKLFLGSPYIVKPSSVRFDQEMVEFNRVHDDEEYLATKLSIGGPIGQLTPICINSETGLCEDGRHRCRACADLGIDVVCILVDGTISKELRIELYNLDSMSGRDLTPAQKAIQAHKFILLTGMKIADAAARFKSSARNVGDANSIAGLGRTDILDTISKTGQWTRPEGGNPIKSIRTIASELRATSQDLEDQEEDHTKIDYLDYVNTEKGKALFHGQLFLIQNSYHEQCMSLVRDINSKYKLKVDQVTGEVEEVATVLVDTFKD